MPLARDGLTALAQACGMTRQTSYAWRSGRRRMSKAVQLLHRLVQIHGLNVLLGGELAQSPSKLAQDSSQPTKPKRTRKNKVK
jgi:hypothetical protein